MFDLYAIRAVYAIPDHDTGVFAHGKVAANLKGFDPSRNGYLYTCRRDTDKPFRAAPTTFSAII
jgi:hypothetical protein